MALKRDRIAEYLDIWEEEHPGEPLGSQLDKIGNDVSAGVRHLSLKQLRSFLNHCESRQIALEREFPELKRIFLSFSVSREDQEHAACTVFIPRLRREIKRRARGSRQTLNVEIEQSPDLRMKRDAKRQEPRAPRRVPSDAESGKLHTPRAGTNVNPEVAKRRTLVRSNPSIPAKEMCETFDRANVPLPPNWQGAGFQKWVRAYGDPNYKTRIEVIISKDRKRI